MDFLLFLKLLIIAYRATASRPLLCQSLTTSWTVTVPVFSSTPPWTVMVSLISYNNSISVFCVTLASFTLISCVFVYSYSHWAVSMNFWLLNFWPAPGRPAGRAERFLFHDLWPSPQKIFRTWCAYALCAIDQRVRYTGTYGTGSLVPRPICGRRKNGLVSIVCASAEYSVYSADIF